MKCTNGYEIKKDIYDAINSIVNHRNLYKGYKILSIQKNIDSYEIEIIFNGSFTNISIPNSKIKSYIIDDKLSKILKNE